MINGCRCGAAYLTLTAFAFEHGCESSLECQLLPTGIAAAEQVPEFFAECDLSCLVENGAGGEAAAELADECGFGAAFIAAVRAAVVVDWDAAVRAGCRVAFERFVARLV